MQKVIFAVFALLIGGAVFCYWARPASVTVRNDFAQPLSKVAVTVQGKKLDFPDLPPGKRVTRWFRNAAMDGHYELEATRADGTQIRQENGYVSGGIFYGEAEFTVTPTGAVTFRENYR